MNATKLRKSVRAYRALIAKLPALVSGGPRPAEYQEAANYLRALYREHGRENVRRALGALL